MARYSHPISDIPLPDEAKLIFDSIDEARKKAQFSVLWRTGARPAEIQALRRKHVKLAKVCRASWRKNLVLTRCNTLNPVDCEQCIKCGLDLLKTQYFIITLPTLKLGDDGTFKVRTRELRFIRPTGMNLDPYLEMIVKYARSLPADDTKLFPYTIRQFEKWISKCCFKVVGKKYSPYHFRHARFTIEGQQGMGVKELQSFKGSASAQSVLGYLHARPFEIEVGD